MACGTRDVACAPVCSPPSADASRCTCGHSLVDRSVVQRSVRPVEHCVVAHIANLHHGVSNSLQRQLQPPPPSTAGCTTWATRLRSANPTSRRAARHWSHPRACSEQPAVSACHFSQWHTPRHSLGLGLGQWHTPRHSRLMPLSR